MFILLGFILFMGVVMFGFSDFVIKKLNWWVACPIYLLGMFLSIFVMTL